MYVAVSGVGAWHSLRRRRIARVFGIQLAGSPLAQALTLGTPLSAPPVMLIALILAEHREREDVIAVLAPLFLLGLLGEADTMHTVRGPTADPMSTICVVLEAALPLAMLRHGVTNRRRPRG